MANNNVDEQVYIIILPYQWLHFLRSHTSKHSHEHRTYPIRWCSQAHIITPCRNGTFAVPLGTLLTHMCVYLFVWNTCIPFSTLFYRIVDVHQQQLHQQPNWYLSSQTQYLLFSLRQSIDPKNLTQCFWTFVSFQFVYFNLPIPHPLLGSHPLCLNFICNICNLIQIWCHIRKNKRTHTYNSLKQMDIHITYTIYMEKEFVTRKHWFGFSDAWHGDELNALIP